MKILFGLFWSGAGAGLGGGIRKEISLLRDDTAKIEWLPRLDLLTKGPEMQHEVMERRG